MTADMNVDPGEIAKFNDIASRWWDPDGEFKPLHVLNPVRLSYISDELQGLFGKTVIDIGCAVGKWMPVLAPIFKTVKAIDISAKNLAIAEKKYKKYLSLISIPRSLFRKKDFDICSRLQKNSLKINV